MAVVCIAGMHRSGTSLVVRILRACGLYLGEEQDLMPAAPDNLEGFGENLRFVRINDLILSAFDGAWDVPPVFPAAWQRDARLLQHRETTLQLLDEFRGREPWGWKDPRTSVTLPYWQEFIPNLRLVIVLRNPVDISRSASARGYSSLAFNARLTQYYFECLISASQPAQRMVVHYDMLFDDTRTEIQRLADFAGLRVGADQLKQACGIINPDFRHSHSTIKQLVHSDVPWELVTSYVELCKEAGPGYRAMLAEELKAGFDSHLDMTNPDFWTVTVQNVRIHRDRGRQRSERERENLQLRRTVAEQQLQLAQMKSRIQEQDGIRANLETELRRKENHNLALFNRLASQQRAIRQLRSELEKRTWRGRLDLVARHALVQRTYQWLKRHRAAIMPPGSTRERLLLGPVRWLMDGNRGNQQAKG